MHIAAAAALYNLEGKDALNVIVKYLDSEIIAESIEAAMSAGYLHDGDIMPLLKKRLSTKQQFLKNALLESLARLGKKIPEQEINFLLEGGQFDSQWTALSIIEILKDKRFNLKLKKKLESNNPLMRIKAAKLLSILSSENMKSVIIEYLLSDRNSYSGISAEDVKILAIYNFIIVF
jgi:HEAT repeat protein